MIHPIIVGTAGHVDHGKSSLVERLTGVDPDRWEEEKRRGLTIDLGFAPLELPDGRLVGMIDVPGHERFLKNMVAGATSVDLALLVVAADDGVMPQTREHLDALELLGVERALVALTKIDLVDEETRDLAVEDVRALFEGRKIRAARIVAVSSVTGEGIEELRAALHEEAGAVAPRSSEGLFRLPVQRVFTLHGFGTVVTGIPLAGRIETGERVEVVGKGLVSRIRGIHAYGRKVSEARAGHSTALNLPELPVTGVVRGDVVAPPGVLAPVDRFEVKIRAVAGQEPLKHGESVHLHCGTKDALARIFLLDRPVLPGGEAGVVQVQAEEPLVVIPGDRVLLRRLAPPRVVAGGRVLGVGGRRLRRFKEEVLGRLAEKERALDDLVRRLALGLEEAGARGLAPEEAAALLGATLAQAEAAFAELEGAGRAHAAARGRRWFSARSVARERRRIEVLLARWFDEHPLAARCPAAELSPGAADKSLFQTALAAMAADGRIALLPGGEVRDLGRGGDLDGAQRQMADEILRVLAAAGTKPKTRAEVLAEFGASAEALVECLVESGAVVSVGPAAFLWTREQYRRALAEAAAVCGRVGGVLEIPKLRDRLQTTRKYLMPLLERFDRDGWTARKGDRRILLRLPAVPGGSAAGD